jgi:uncharacterized protein YbjT (DUF2867 family)
MKRIAIIIGASGLVGYRLVNQLLNHAEFEKVRIFVRGRTGIIHSNLEENIIDFKQPESWRHLVKGDVLFSTLGTTIKKAKTKENQYRVDFTYQYEFAKAAAENGVSTYVLVSSIGANPKSLVFYSRIKGELEVAVAQLNFRKLLIFRPSILDGHRREQRVGERIGLVFSRVFTRFVFRKYRPTPTDVLARKMIRMSVDQTEGFRMVEGLEILK